ncbi:putative F-box/FBD/LRR-repeat protein At5g44950 [Capsella rubella]|uniref:putative F-box/FBD/LRR-repeat protein At5g44950 n=1 Tax=Capsella rubella TaxID=81985 RepID=UPI000CD4F6E7|nr:putative F-box/FBD/LRR-repeat protein At5g44950 [Capsella rubella]
MDLDRISALSDSLLTHILSYLLIEDSIKTSVLSKRWEFLWLKVPVMDLTTVKISLRGEAMSWLMRRFLELNRGSSLQRFNIKYIDSIDGNNGVMDLISEVIHRGVQHLEADMCETMQQGGVISLMPKYLYVSKTLVSLKLVNVGLENPRFVASLPNLKMMHLKNIYYKNQYGLLIIKMLILASPLLEDLTFDFPELEKKRKQIDFWRNFSDSPMLGETDDDLTNVPLCLISTLEYVKINRLVMKEENGLKLVNYFLENSVVLKKLTLSFTHSSVTNQQLESYKKLITSTKLSPTCQVIFD